MTPSPIGQRPKYLPWCKGPFMFGHCLPPLLSGMPPPSCVPREPLLLSQYQPSTSSPQTLARCDSHLTSFQFFLALGKLSGTIGFPVASYTTATAPVTSCFFSHLFTGTVHQEHPMWHVLSHELVVQCWLRQTWPLA